MGIRVQTQAFDAGVELGALHAANLGVGAVAVFVGYVRDFNDGREVAGMFLEHAPGMTEKALERIVAEAQARWPLLGVEVIHRVGELEPGAPIVFVGVTSAHRDAAFDACRFVMDYLRPARRSGRRKTPPTGRAGSKAARATSRRSSAGSAETSAEAEGQLVEQQGEHAHRTDREQGDAPGTIAEVEAYAEDDEAGDDHQQQLEEGFHTVLLAG